jgi:hypothetical protein
MKLLLAIGMAILSVAAVACTETSSSGPEPGAACGGRAGATCAADQYCEFANNRCGTDDVTGRCMPRPSACPALLVAERTCGCDQKVYSSACEAMLSGTDLNETGSCALDPGAFACGYRQCSRSNEFCQHSVSDVGDAADGYTCRGLPTGCGTNASCSCLSGQPCASLCAGDSARGLTLTCPGG